ncbi:MAG: hypothetical protein QG556_574 [Pseudomonadota bacterium]|nr:hypothetical protein [Pseudomonadota bacterium]
MSRYAIGDLQGHVDGLKCLLDSLGRIDELWFVGDLVNRGPNSLEILRFLKNMQPTPKIVLGNHDLYLLYLVYAKNPNRGKDDLEPLLQAPDRDELCVWLKAQDWLIEDKDKKLIMTHAGIAPMWSIEEAKKNSVELKTYLQDEVRCRDFFTQYFSTRPSRWDDHLQGMERLLVAADYFTRMRLTLYDGRLDWRFNGELKDMPSGSFPWFACPIRKLWDETIIFGHWAALGGKTGFKKFQAIDTGFCWGGRLTALNLDTFERISI